MARVLLGAAASGTNDATRRADVDRLLGPIWQLPNGAIRATIPRAAVNSATGSPLLSGRISCFAIWLEAGDVVNSLTFVSGSTAGATLVHRWAALTDSSRVKLAISADDTSASWAANTAQTYAMTTPYTVTTSGWYYASLCVVGTTIPTLMAASGAAAVWTVGLGAANVPANGASSTGQGAPSGAPSTFGAFSTQTSAQAWAWAS